MRLFIMPLQRVAINFKCVSMNFQSLRGFGVFDMGQIFSKDEQHLSQLATEVSGQMTELRQLRELVRLQRPQSCCTGRRG